jgi:hypothetical protein
MGKIGFDNTEVIGKFSLKSFKNINLETVGIFKDQFYIEPLSEDIIFNSYKDDTEGHNLVKQTFDKNGFISSEAWEQSITLQARILEHNSEIISCECLINQENKEFELREFPAYLFANLNLKSTEFVLIKLRQKPGSSRIDIYNGEKIINKSIFEINNLWDDLENSGLDEPLQLIND